MRAGTVLDGRYELVERIGAGGFGQVWEAYDPKIDRWVAVKILTWDDSPDNTRQAARFAREAAVAGGLSHPSIVTVHDFGSTVHDGHQVAYLVMELIDGEPLSTALQAGPLGRADTLDIAYCVADALAAAHDANLVHRDIKPANIMVPDEGATAAKVVDFGITKSADPEHHITATGLLIGTPAYMAPETFTGELDHRSDLYALGCVLHEALAGTPPFTGATFWNLAHQHATQPPPALRTLRPDVYPELEDLVARLLAKNPDDRPQDAHQTRTALNEIGDRYYGRHAPRRGKDLNTDVTLSREEARHGATVPLRQSAHSTCPDCAGDPRRQDGGWCSLCRGTGLVPNRVQVHQVRFPAGLREGQRVRLRGLGERGTNGGENGDLYVTIHVVP
ncbi:protein kinase domain-containing protein [Kitasatospora purpeofusca]|uniref:protein kinase domain-containing protein n=1 Tax=Kitasatospora purpeofusca TaxID=67352 RepID=UPI00364CE63C